VKTWGRGAGGTLGKDFGDLMSQISEKQSPSSREKSWSTFLNKTVTSPGNHPEELSMWIIHYTPHDLGLGVEEEPDCSDNPRRWEKHLTYFRSGRGGRGGGGRA
jgi:hypothetical protein